MIITNKFRQPDGSAASVQKPSTKIVLKTVWRIDEFYVVCVTTEFK